MISQSTVEDVKASARIAEVIGDFVTIKKIGANYECCCMFHEEKTPSFKIHVKENYYKCFGGCGKSGDPVQFLIDYKKWTYQEAIIHLANKYKIIVIHDTDTNTQKKVYVKPVWKNNTELPDKVVKWFEQERKISQATLQKMRVTTEKTWMPEGKYKDGNGNLKIKPAGDRDAICFNYFRDGELINIKYRDSIKTMRMFKDAELILYNLDSLKEATEAAIIEGECFHPDAEVLTPKGWIALKDWNEEDVAQYNLDGSISFVKPLNKIEKHFDGELIEFSNQQKFYSLTTPKHNLVLRTLDGDIIKKTAETLPTNGFIPRTALHDGKGIRLSDDEIRLCIAVSADFTIRKGGDIYGTFQRQRKKDRITELLNRLKIPFTTYVDKTRVGYDSFFIRRGNAPNYLFKLFPMEWIYKSTRKQKQLILDEMLVWDGNSVPNREQIEFSSKEIHNATFMQTISSLCGYCSTIIPRKNEFGNWFKVSVLFKKQFTSTQSLVIAKNKKQLRYTGNVYCLTVDSGMLLIRQNQCISVSGNCDVLAAVEAGVEREGLAILSVPNGANIKSNNLTYLDSATRLTDVDDKGEYIVKKIYLATDNDVAGRKLREDLAERFGKERCYFIEWKDQKDCNDVLKVYGKQGVLECFNAPKEFPLVGAYPASAFTQEVKDLYINGLDMGVGIGIEEFDKQLKFAKGYLTVVTGISSHGKSSWLDQVCIMLNNLHGWKIAYYSPENRPTKLHISNIIRKLIGKNWFGGQKMTEQEMTLAINYLEGRFYWIKPEKDFSLKSVLEHAKMLKLRHGIDAVVLDAWNKFEHKLGKAAETQYISEQLDLLVNSMETLNLHGFLVAHPTKQEKIKGSINYVIPNLYSIAGSAAFFSKADNGICVYRDYETGKNHVFIQKVRYQHHGALGETSWQFEKESGRFDIVHAGGIIHPDTTNWITKQRRQAVMEIPASTPEIILNYEDPPF